MTNAPEIVLGVTGSIGAYKAGDLVRHLRDRGVLATGLGYPVVPRGEEEIRFQLSADHTVADVDAVLAALAAFPGRPAPLAPR